MVTATGDLLANFTVGREIQGAHYNNRFPPNANNINDK